jgi:hypothetical protein
MYFFMYSRFFSFRELSDPKYVQFGEQYFWRFTRRTKTFRQVGHRA